MLTVVLATRDRAGLLARTLDAMTRVTAPDHGWALIVVDNASTDATADVLRGFASLLPLTVLREARPGMSAALNAALPHLRGDLTVKADDDVLPDPDWLAHYREAADAYPRATLFGGTVAPEWPGAPPRWLWTDARALGMLYALTSPADGACSPRDIYGPHWAVRTSVFADGLRLDETMGPDATKPHYAMGSESELFARLAASGHGARHVARARVRHIIRPEQLTEAWILGRADRCGRGAAALGRPGGRTPALRRLAYRALAMAVAPLPPSRARLRIMLTDRLLAGMATARPTAARSEAADAMIPLSAAASPP